MVKHFHFVHPQEHNRLWNNLHLHVVNFTLLKPTCSLLNSLYYAHFFYNQLIYDFRKQECLLQPSREVQCAPKLFRIIQIHSRARATLLSLTTGSSISYCSLVNVEIAIWEILFEKISVFVFLEVWKIGICGLNKHTWWCFPVSVPLDWPCDDLHCQQTISSCSSAPLLFYNGTAGSFLLALWTMCCGAQLVDVLVVKTEHPPSLQALPHVWTGQIWSVLTVLALQPCLMNSFLEGTFPVRWWLM